MRLEHRLALRNLLRNRRRTGLTAAIVVLTVALMTVFLGLSDGGHRAMIDVGVRMGLGHLIVHRRGYVDDPSLDRLIPQAGAQARALRAALPELAAAVPRLRLDALIEAGGNIVAIKVSGVDPAQETRVSGIADARAIVRGRTLAAPAPAPVADGELPGIVIGQQVAGVLGVELGDRVTLTVQPAHQASFARAAFRLVGVFRTGMQEFDGFWAEVPLPAAQRLARTGDQASEIALYLRDDRQLGAVAARLAPLLAGRPLEVQRWSQAAPELSSAVALDAAGMWLLMVIVFIVVAAGILNTVVLSVMRRAREFGLMLALGSSPGLVVRVVFVEAVYLTAASVALGMALGVAAHLYFATRGLDFRAVFGTTLEAGGVVLPDRFYSVLSPVKLAYGAAFVSVLTLLATTYPALKASRMSPLQASRHV